jgi:hypothetical protein
MTIDDLIRELEEFRKVYGNLTVKFLSENRDEKSRDFGYIVPSDVEISVTTHPDGLCSILAIQELEK